MSTDTWDFLSSPSILDPRDAIHLSPGRTCVQHPSQPLILPKTPSNGSVVQQVQPAPWWLPCCKVFFLFSWIWKTACVPANSLGYIIARVGPIISPTLPSCHDLHLLLVFPRILTVKPSGMWGPVCLSGRLESRGPGAMCPTWQSVLEEGVEKEEWMLAAGKGEKGSQPGLLSTEGKGHSD